jgi:hypothetical protein
MYQTIINYLVNETLSKDTRVHIQNLMSYIEDEGFKFLVVSMLYDERLKETIAAAIIDDC